MTPVAVMVGANRIVPAAGIIHPLGNAEMCDGCDMVTDDGRRFALVPPNRLVGSRGTSIVQKRPAEPQAPERGRPDLVAGGGSLFDTVAGADIMQEKIGMQGNRFAIEERIRVWTRHQNGRVAGRAAGEPEKRFAIADGFVHRSAFHGSEELHEVREVVDAAQAGTTIPDVLDSTAGAT